MGELKLSEVPERDFFLVEDPEEKPMLVLGIRRDWVREDELVLLPGRDWFRCQHQSGGVACHHLVLAAAIVLTPKSGAVVEGMRQISKEYFGTDLGCFPVSVDELVRYRELLRKHLQVDCNRDYQTLEEAVYPVDLDYVSDLTSDPLPANLNDLVRWEYQRFVPLLPPFGLWILGPNSD